MANLATASRRPGAPLDKVVWANWSLKDPTEFDEFNDEWVRWFPADPPSASARSCRRCSAEPASGSRSG